MFAFYDNSDYLKRRFPGLLIETNLIERFLESKAEKGEIFVSFSAFGLSGYFEKSMPKKYHYCIDVYYRPLKKEELDTEEFSEYKETCLACGWKYVCIFENIVVFCSEEEKRPQELQTDSELQRSILKRITLKTEIRQMLVRVPVSIFLILMYSFNMYLLWFRNSAADKYWWDISFFFPWAFILGLTIWEIISHIRLVLIVQNERPIPRSGLLWNRSGLVEIFLCIWTISIMFVCFWFRFYFHGICAVFAFLLLAGDFFYGMWTSKKQGKDYRIWRDEQNKTVQIVGAIAVFLLLWSSLNTIPLSDRSYRFSIESAVKRNGMDYKDGGGKDIVYDSALSQSDAAFLEEPQEWRVKDNSGHYTDFEHLVYIQDSYSEETEHSTERCFYVGTLTARLLDEKKLDTYLKEKHLTLDGAKTYALVPNVDSYLLPSGKEIIHIRKDMVVMHFLDKRDVRSFSLDELAVRNAVAEKVRASLELYSQ